VLRAVHEIENPQVLLASSSLCSQCITVSRYKISFLQKDLRVPGRLV